MSEQGALPMIVLTTVADKAAADRLASTLVEARLAACVVRFPVHSTYRWEGSVCHDEEWQLMIKTSSDRRDALEKEVKRTSGYDLPEFVVVEGRIGASEGYLDWLIDSCAAADRIP